MQNDAAEKRGRKTTMEDVRSTGAGGVDERSTPPNYTGAIFACVVDYGEGKTVHRSQIDRNNAARLGARHVLQ